MDRIQETAEVVERLFVEDQQPRNSRSSGLAFARRVYSELMPRYRPESEGI
jgi:hypothetical protein